LDVAVDIKPIQLENVSYKNKNSKVKPISARDIPIEINGKYEHLSESLSSVRTTSPIFTVETKNKNQVGKGSNGKVEKIKADTATANMMTVTAIN
jgi:hypothetical protein